MRTEISFEVKNGAYRPETIVREIWQMIVRTMVKQPVDSDDTIRGRIEALREELETLDLSHYYMESGAGAKITKPIKKLLLRFFDKQAVEEAFPGLCKGISALYMPKMEVRAFWGDKRKLGAGVWEHSETCFADNGCNRESRVFLEKFKRAKALVLESQVEQRMFYARSIAFFAGGRSIYLSNFYYNGLPQNHLLFVEALRRVLNLPAIKFSTGVSLPLPIYKNRDGIRCYDGRSKNHKGRILYPCPHCDEKVFKLVSSISGHTHHIGCSDECADISSYTCSNCDGGIDEDDHRHAPNGEDYCEGCYDEHVAYCDACDNDVWMNDYLGNGYCNECGYTCYSCQDTYSRSDRYEGSDEEDYCENCYHKKFVECFDCDKAVKREEALQDQDGDDFCKDCYSDKYLDCKECGDETRRDDAEDGLCPDCHAKREKEKEEADENATVNA